MNDYGAERLEGCPAHLAADGLPGAAAHDYDEMLERAGYGEPCVEEIHDTLEQGAVGSDADGGSSILPGERRDGRYEMPGQTVMADGGSEKSAEQRYNEAVWINRGVYTVGQVMFWGGVAGLKSVPEMPKDDPVGAVGVGLGSLVGVVGGSVLTILGLDGASTWKRRRDGSGGKNW